MKKAVRLGRDTKHWDAWTALRDRVDSFKRTLPILSDLSNPVSSLLQCNRTNPPGPSREALERPSNWARTDTHPRWPSVHLGKSVRTRPWPTRRDHRHPGTGSEQGACNWTGASPDARFFLMLQALEKLSNTWKEVQLDVVVYKVGWFLSLELWPRQISFVTCVDELPSFALRWGSLPNTWWQLGHSPNHEGVTLL